MPTVDLTTIPATVDHAAGIAAVHRDGWRSGYRGIVPDAHLDAIYGDERTEWWQRTLGPEAAVSDRGVVAVTGDGSGARVIGFAWGGSSGDPDTFGDAELATLYVLAEHWSTGVGRRLLADWRSAAVGAGFGQARLWTFTANERAQRAYRADGWIPDGATSTRTFAGHTVGCLRFSRPLG